MKDREIREMIEAEELRVESIERGRHKKVVVRNRWDETASVVFPSTPGDHRNRMNLRAILRRIARGVV